MVAAVHFEIRKASPLRFCYLPLVNDDLWAREGSITKYMKHVTKIEILIQSWGKG